MKLLSNINIKSYTKLLILSFWLVQNLILFTKGFPTSGNDNLTLRSLEMSSL